MLWRAGFDGAMDYAYQHGFHHIWNDFDDRSCRDHVFACPTVNGVVGTIQWEGFREGVDDVRYVATLEKANAAAAPGQGAIAEEARRWLRSLDVAEADFGESRRQMVGWILKLRGNAAPGAR